MVYFAPSVLFIYLHFLTGILLSVVLINIVLHSCAQGTYLIKNFVCLAESIDDICTLHITLVLVDPDSCVKQALSHLSLFPTFAAGFK